MRTFLLLTLIAVLFMPGALRGQAGDFYVDAVMGSDVMGDGTAGSPWQTITCGLSRVTGPDVTLHVAPGTYDANLGEQFPLFLGDGVSLVGDGMGQTTIATTSTVVISGTAVSNLELSQLTVDGLEEAEIAVQLRSSAVSLNQVELTQLTKAGLWSIDDQGSSFHAGRITHIHAPDVDWHGVDGIAYGINLQGVTFSLADSRLDDLEGGSDPGWGWASGQAYGVKLTATSNVYLSNNQIEGIVGGCSWNPYSPYCASDWAVFVEYGNQMQVEGNKFEQEMEILEANQAMLTGNTLADLTVEGVGTVLLQKNSAHDVHISGSNTSVTLTRQNLYTLSVVDNNRVYVSENILADVHGRDGSHSYRCNNSGQNVTAIHAYNNQDVDISRNQILRFSGGNAGPIAYYDKALGGDATGINVKGNQSTRLWNNVIADLVGGNSSECGYTYPPFPFTASGNAFGIRLQDEVDAAIWNNTLYLGRPGATLHPEATPGRSWAISITNSIAIIGNNILSDWEWGLGCANSGNVVVHNAFWNLSQGEHTGCSLQGGNLTADPQFVAAGHPDHDDLHLQAGSPLVDAGGFLALPTDLDGDHRPWGEGPDIGADEFLPELVRAQWRASAVNVSLDDLVTYTLTLDGRGYHQVGNVTVTNTLPISTSLAPGGLVVSSGALTQTASGWVWDTGPVITGSVALTYSLRVHITGTQFLHNIVWVDDGWRAVFSLDWPLVVDGWQVWLPLTASETIPQQP